MARREERAAYLFLSPWLLGVTLFWLVPIAASLIISLLEWNIIRDPHWVDSRTTRTCSTTGSSGCLSR